ncbi:hypothetical protein BDU57DRAFT_41201 [Ampelomyces quisqualis]|uniref:Carrier domain-containing protein n=1 Tax=Ampelomyces quisqualis TaxID=50730 RepID=A0A6A5QZJ1_AMPQU|nr:hypothetical protein BDU57DRAFT_41201 [Ampelomyces quisqualis]
MSRKRNQTANQHLSIINPHPQLIKGPDLLHHLVAPPSTATAIDFLEDGSNRRKVSYKTLHALSDSLAQNISSVLEKLEHASSIIPVLLPQSPELYIVLLAILKAGKAFCPLSLDAPAERLDFILNDISADLLITNSEFSNLLDGRPSVPNLRLLLTIGEMLTRDVVEEYGSSESKDGILWAMYGPTEAAIHCTLQPLILTDASTQMIGFPLDTVSAFIALPASEGQNSTLSILPVGEEGELVVGGHQIADGYLNRAELTAASFMHHPQYGPLYRTGDRARLRDDGTFECLGRVLNGQVKLRGQRVELGEIEHVIMMTEGCRAAVAMVVDEALVAFCAIGSCQVSRTHVLQTCKQWLPGIMIPHDVIFVHRIPQLPSGKIDRSALVTMHRHELHRGQFEQRNSDLDTGHFVLDTLKLQLRHDVTPESTCAETGLDSLQAIRLASVLRAKGYQITALQILAARTLHEIMQAAHLARPDEAVPPSRELNSTTYTLQDLPELESWQSAIDHVLPCTPLQEAMLAETISRSSAYCNWVEVELPKKYTFKEIQVALQALAQRNEILRSGFHPTVKQEVAFVQVVWQELTEFQVQQDTPCEASTIVSDAPRHVRRMVC